MRQTHHNLFRSSFASYLTPIYIIYKCMQMSSSCQIKSVKHLKNVYLLHIIPAENYPAVRISSWKSINIVIKSYLNRSSANLIMEKLKIKNLISSNISWHMNIKMWIKLKCEGVTLICKRDNKNQYTWKRSRLWRLIRKRVASRENRGLIVSFRHKNEEISLWH